MKFTGIGGCPNASGVPIFYHCSNDVEERDNGALEGAAGAFSEDDEVIVQCSYIGGVYTPLRVIGFTDKPKSCGFKFKLTLGDGTLITEESGLLIDFDILTRVGFAPAITEPIYTPVPATGEDTDGYWSFKLLHPEDEQAEGYWVAYSCIDGIGTQYPYAYKPADKYLIENRIQYGAYEDIIPYYVVSSYPWIPVRDYSHGLSTEHYWSDDFPEGWGDVWITGSIRAGHWRLIDPTILELNRTLTIKSSVPYKVTYYGYAKVVRALFYVYGEVPSYSFDNDCYYEIISSGGNKTITPAGDGLESTITYDPSIIGREHLMSVEFIPREEGYRVIAIDYPSELGITPIGTMTPTYII